MSSRSSSLSLIAIAAGLAIASGTAMAQSYEAVRLQTTAPGRDGGYIGAAVIAGTEYRGSEERRTMFLPSVEYQWANGWFAGVSNGIGFNFSNDPSLQYGARLTVDMGREESRSAALKGMGDLDTKVEVGGFLNYSLVPGVSLTSSLRTGSGKDNNGSLLDLGLGYSTKLNDQWRFGVGAGLTWANDAYMQSYFGVTGAQSKTSGYSTYTPGSALRDVRVRVSLAYLVAPRVLVSAAVTSSSLSDEAKRSPIVRKADTVNGVLTVAYAF